MDINQLSKQTSNKNVLVICPNPAIDIYTNMEAIQDGLPNRFSNEERFPGGKGVHIAMALAEVGINVTLAGFWGGITGQWIKSQCQARYPSINIVGVEVEEWSRLCYTVISENKEIDHTEFLGEGPLLSSTLIERFMTEIKNQVKKSDTIVCSGSWPKGATGNEYQKIIEIGKDHNLDSFLDCTGIQLKNALTALPFGIHLNRHESTTYSDAKDFNASKEVLLKYCTNAYITDGKEGLYACNLDQEIHTKITLKEIISTVGSGDCLLAGIVAGYIFDQSPTEIAKLGATFGSANCLRAELGMLYKKDISSLYQQVEHEVLSYHED